MCSSDLDEEYRPEIQEDSIHCLDENMSGMFLTKEEHDESDHEVNKGEEPSDYLKGYQHAIFGMQKLYNLRNKNVPITANKTKPKKDAPKAAEVMKDTLPPPPAKETEKYASIFSLESEISKIKIPVPFRKIIKVNQYISKIVKMLNSQPGATDILNIQEYHPTIYLGPRLENEQNEEVPPFYVSLSIRE